MKHEHVALSTTWVSSSRAPNEFRIDIRVKEPRTSLLNRIKTRPGVITWDKTGQVKIEGETIPNSNISDLVSDAMRSRKDFNPTGAKKFFQALTKLNVPKDLVRNQNWWKQLGDTPYGKGKPLV